MTHSQLQSHRQYQLPHHHLSIYIHKESQPPTFIFFFLRRRDIMKLHFNPLSLIFFFFLFGAAMSSNQHDYSDALSKSILFFEGQRSGYLPNDQRLTWRRNSGLSDGWTHSTDLTGGYYDAGDNVKFNFPMAFTTTMLAWSVIEFGELMPPPELRNALVALRWSSDYLLKSVSQLPNRIFVQVRSFVNGNSIS